MKLKDIKFDRFPVYVQYNHLSKQFIRDTIVIGSSTMPGSPYRTDEPDPFGVNYNLLWGELEVLHWEYLDATSFGVAITLPGAIDSAPNVNNNGDEEVKSKGTHKCMCPKENFTINPIGCMCDGT